MNQLELFTSKADSVPMIMISIVWDRIQRFGLYFFSMYNLFDIVIVV